MPNHVESVIEFKGTSDEVAKVLDAVKENDPVEGNRIFSFNKIIPMPSTVYAGDLGKKEEEEHGENNWYDWSIKNWGTKWNAYDVRIRIAKSSNAEKFITEERRSQARIYFSTAWSPVPNILSKLSEMFPKVEFKYAYDDEGGGFAGKEAYLNGEQISETDSFSSAKSFLRKEPRLFKTSEVEEINQN